MNSKEVALYIFNDQSELPPNTKRPSGLKPTVFTFLVKSEIILLFIKNNNCLFT